MKIIIATDGTTFGDAAIEMLKNLAISDGDEISVVTVIDMAMPFAAESFGGYMPDMGELEKNARENAEKIVTAAVGKINGFFPDKKVVVTSDILFGSADSRIVETAESMTADLIVLGSHGYKVWERLLLGSVSNSVVHHAPCSVLVVRTGE